MRPFVPWLCLCFVLVCLMTIYFRMGPQHDFFRYGLAQPCSSDVHFCLAQPCSPDPRSTDRSIMSSFKYETPAQSYLANRILPGGAEDRSFIKLFPQYMDVHQLWNGRRKIFLDVGASTYESSVVWFREKYPVTFDEIHVWEAEAGKFRIPPSEDRTFASKIIDHSPVMVDVPERPRQIRLDEVRPQYHSPGRLRCPKNGYRRRRMARSSPSYPVRSLNIDRRNVRGNPFRSSQYDSIWMGLVP